MDTTLITRFAPAIRNFNGNASDPALLMASAGLLNAYYAPFDAVNPHARVILVGITPGRTQAQNALAEAKRQLLAGATLEQAVVRAKATGAFSGTMRPNLVAMLDHVGLARWLGIRSCDELFGTSSHLLQTASVLPFPVFVAGENYNGTPDIVATPMLRDMLLRHFAALPKALPGAVLLPLGPVPTKALDWLVAQGHLDGRRVLRGMPHPSGANGERIQYFLGRKERGLLSKKTDPAKLDAALRDIRSQLLAA